MNRHPFAIVDANIFDSNLITAAFTAANLDFAGTDQPVDGLDLGLNTPTPPEQSASNRSAVLQQLQLPTDSLAFAKQIHSTQVTVVDKPGLYADCDGLVTSTRGISLGILVADCAAVLVADSSAGVIGAFHAGWRGAAGGIIAKGLALMRELGGADFKAWVSPCIGINAFEVGDEVASAFPGAFVHRDGFEKPHIDLAGFVCYSLEQAGVASKAIRIDGRCTVSDSQFYSFRRQKDKSGRMMGVIALR